MKVFNPTNLTHTIKIIPRKYEDVLNIVIRHELKDETTIVTDFTDGIDNGYVTIVFPFNFKEGASYEITINGITTLMYRDKGYATSEIDLENYKLL